MQHLQNPVSGKSESKKTSEAKAEAAVKGLGKNGGLLKDIKKKLDEKNSKTEQGKEVSLTNILDLQKSSANNQKESEKQDEEKENMWKKLLPEASYLRLKESETGLHLKSPDELIEMAHKTSLDKGKLEDVVNCGTKAISKLVAVCSALPYWGFQPGYHLSAKISRYQ